MPPIETESRKALHELIGYLREADERWAGEAYGADTPARVAESHRALMHMVQGGLVSWFEDDVRDPLFRRIVSPSRKFTGDNADAIYYDCAISSDYSYRVSGCMAGAQYVSITVEKGTSEGHFSTGTAGVLNDTMFDVDEGGNFELFLGGPERERNWIPLDPEASRLTTRHYIEQEVCSAADRSLYVPMEIECLDSDGPAPPPDDAEVAAGIRRVMNFAAARTTARPPPSPDTPMPPFVSRTPNEFVAPVKPGEHAFAAFDAAYSQCRFEIRPDEALVITGRWPECRAGNISLWTQHIQSFDYARRRVSLNRAQTQLGDDGRFEMVIAHEDPGHPNWMDCEGRSEGTIFWRFMLPEGEIETPQARLVKLSEL